MRAGDSDVEEATLVVEGPAVALAARDGVDRDEVPPIAALLLARVLRRGARGEAPFDEAGHGDQGPLEPLRLVDRRDAHRVGRGQ